MIRSNYHFQMFLQPGHSDSVLVHDPCVTLHLLKVYKHLVSSLTPQVMSTTLVLLCWPELYIQSGQFLRGKSLEVFCFSDMVFSI